MKDQITLLQTSIDKFADSIKDLSHNQVILESRIKQLTEIINSHSLRNTEIKHQFWLQTVFSQFIAPFQIINDVLQQIEVAITFSKSNTFHNSIVEPENLLSAIIDVDKVLKKNKFPFDLNLNNILLFERAIKIKSYSKGNKIIFALEVPIVESMVYDYYHLYSLPTPSENSYKMIVPKAKYLLSNEQTYALMNTRCLEITAEEYLCEEQHMSEIKEESPCEVQLLNYSKDIKTCKHISTIITDTMVQKIEKNQWIVISPSQVFATQQCGKSRERLSLIGTYVVELSNSDCEITLKDILLKTFQPRQLKFKTVQLPKFTDSIANSDQLIFNQTLKLETLNLDNLNNVHSALELQKSKLDNITEFPIYIHRISLYTILIYVIIIFTCMYGIYRCCKKRTAGKASANPLSYVSPIII